MYKKNEHVFCHVTDAPGNFNSDKWQAYLGLITLKPDALINIRRQTPLNLSNSSFKQLENFKLHAMRKFSITIVGAKKWKADVLESELFKYKQNGSTDYNIKAKLHLTLNKFGIKVWHHLSKLRLLEVFLIFLICPNDVLNQINGLLPEPILTYPKISFSIQ